MRAGVIPPSQASATADFWVIETTPKEFAFMFPVALHSLVPVAEASLRKLEGAENVGEILKSVVNSDSIRQAELVPDDLRNSVLVLIRRTWTQSNPVKPSQTILALDFLVSGFLGVNPAQSSLLKVDKG
jgi:hypothetical protein